MADIKVTNASISDRHPLQKVAVFAKKNEDSPQAAVKRVDEAVRVLVDSNIEKSTAVSPPSERAGDKPAITEQAAGQLALDVRQKLKDGNLSFAGAPDKSVLSQFA